MKSKILLLFIAAVGILSLKANYYYVSPSGNDSNSGSEDAPFLNLSRAIEKAKAGTTIYLREGRYLPSVSNIMKVKGESNVYDCVFFLSANGTSQKPITISGILVSQKIRKGIIFSICAIMQLELR